MSSKLAELTVTVQVELDGIQQYSYDEYAASLPMPTVMAVFDPEPLVGAAVLHVDIAFVLACADALDLTGRWGFTWALTCSKPRLDGFGGGAQVIDLGQRRSLAWVDCDHWLASTIETATGSDPHDTPG